MLAGQADTEQLELGVAGQVLHCQQARDKCMSSGSRVSQWLSRPRLSLTRPRRALALPTYGELVGMEDRGGPPAAAARRPIVVLLVVLLLHSPSPAQAWSVALEEVVGGERAVA